MNSNINITKIEVWITNIGAATTDNRNIVAFMDLGEYTPYNKNITYGPSPHISPHYPSTNQIPFIILYSIF